MPRPVEGDYNQYYDRYVQLVGGDDIISILNMQSNETQQLLNSIPESKTEYSYAEGKWTIKEVVGHLLDTERIFAFRALAIARNEKQPLPGFEQDDYVVEGRFNNRTFADLLYEFRLLRESNLLLFRSFTDEMKNRRGVANDSEITVSAIMYIIAGHELHHMNVLRERYI